MHNVLVFHAVTDKDWFEEMICWLKRSYQLVPIEVVTEFYRRGARLNRACHLTIDDGDSSFYEVMFPVLRRHRIPASLFVSPLKCLERTNFWFQEIRGYSQATLINCAADVLKVAPQSLRSFHPASIFKTMPLAQMTEVIQAYQRRTNTPRQTAQNITIENLREIAASGLVSIGAHTMNHPILKNEDDSTSEFEIAASIKDLSRILGCPVEYFAYPNGVPGFDFTQREEEFLQHNGIRMAFTTRSSHLNIRDNPFRIPRLPISDQETFLRLKAKLLLGSGWETLRVLAGAREYRERRRLSRTLRREPLPSEDAIGWSSRSKVDVES